MPSQDFSPVPVSDRVDYICVVNYVCNLLSNLKTNKSSGSDGIHPFFLKSSAGILARPLCHIFNLSFASGIFPREWKIADVCPVPKSKPVKKELLRPISLLPIVSKICERVVLKRYADSLLNCYDNFQFAYRRKSSTVIALITVHDTILRLLDNLSVGAVRVITFDMSRAFDRIPHHLLLSCLSNCDLPDRGSFVNWLNSYLSSRLQRVKLGNTTSSCLPVTSGVPQGSILGPYLFSVYFASYKSLEANNYVFKYADDVTLILPVLKHSFDDCSSVNNEIDHFKSWCETHGMSINFSKTKVLNINFSSHLLSLMPNLENVHCLKILGLYFNDKLNWSTHFDFISKKISQRLYVLRILKPLLSHDKLVMVFSAIIQSLLDYASSVFLNPGFCLDSQLRLLCKRAFRIIHYNVSGTCEKCDFLNVQERRQTLAMKLFRLSLLSSDHLLHHLLPNFSHRSKRLILPFVRTKRRADGFVFSCSLSYNQTL